MFLDESVQLFCDPDMSKPLAQTLYQPEDDSAYVLMKLRPYKAMILQYNVDEAMPVQGYKRIILTKQLLFSTLANIFLDFLRPDNYYQSSVDVDESPSIGESVPSIAPLF